MSAKAELFTEDFCLNLDPDLLPGWLCSEQEIELRVFGGKHNIEKEQSWKLISPDFKNYYKVTVINQDSIAIRVDK